MIIRRRVVPGAVRLLGLLLLAGVAAGAGEVAAFKETEPNDDAHNPLRVTAPCDVAATVDEEARTHYFRFEVQAPTFVRITVPAVPGLKFALILWPGEGDKELGRDEPGGAGRPGELARRLERETYLLEVHPEFAGGARAKTPFTVQLRQTTLLDYKVPDEQIKAAIKKGLSYLAAHQQKPDGSFVIPNVPHAATGLALMAFVDEDLPEFKATVEKAVGFIERSYVKPGKYLPDDPRTEAQTAGALIGKAPNDFYITNLLFMYEQSIATLGMAVYVHQSRDEAARKMLGEAAKLLIRSQNTAAKPETLNGPADPKSQYFGGWRYHPFDGASDLSVSGWCILALVASEMAGATTLPTNVKQDYMAFCRRCFNEKLGAYSYNPDGVWSNTTNSVGVLTTLVCVGLKCPVVGKAVQKLREDLPLWETDPVGGYPFYYWYYASRALYMLGGDDWLRWEAVICPMLLRHQNDDGSWDAAEKEQDLGKGYSTTMAILILQLCRGRAPFYIERLKLAPKVEPKVEPTTYTCPQCVADIEALLDAAARDGRSSQQLIEQERELIRRYRGK